jgi:hypothetical protein
VDQSNDELMVVSYAVQYTPRTFIFEVTEPCQMPKPETTYQSYLLRLWHAKEPGAPWHMMLECITEPGQRHYFKDLASLTSYLSTQQAQAEESKGGTDIEQSMDPKPIQTD